VNGQIAGRGSGAGVFLFHQDHDVIDAGQAVAADWPVGERK
jgi:hypothetical protein